MTYWSSFYMSSVYCVVYRTTRVRIRLKIGVQCYARACLMSMRTVWEDSFSHVLHLEESAREIFSLLTTASSRTPGLWLKEKLSITTHSSVKMTTECPSLRTFRHRTLVLNTSSGLEPGFPALYWREKPHEETDGNVQHSLEFGCSFWKGW